MRQKFLVLFFSALLCSTFISAQTVSTFVNGLATPVGLEFDGDGNLWVTQVGMGSNDGIISAIAPDGTIHDVITGLPSVVNPANNETIGPWRTMQMPNNRLLVISGEGSEPLSGSLLTYDLSNFTLGDTPLNANDFEDAFNVQDYVFAQGYDQSNIYSLAMNAAGDQFIVDAAANAIIKRDIATDELSVFAEFPDIVVAFPPGNPPRNEVPTKIISDGADGFYVGTLTGFPFNTGTASVKHVAADGTISNFLSSFSMVTDLGIDPTDGNLTVLEFANFSFAQGFSPSPTPFKKVNPADSTISIMASQIGVLSAFTFDQNGDAYASSIFTGEILKIEFNAPANDALCDATPIAVGDDCNGIPNLNTNLATVEMNEPIFTCPSSTANGADTVVRNSVWFSFVAPANDVHIVAAADDASSGSAYQMNLFSLDGDCTDLTNLELVACDVPVTNIQAGASIITSGLTQGETYYVQVSGRLFPFPGSTLFSAPGCLTITEAVAPANDDACNAIELMVDAPAQVFSNVGATAEAGEIVISPPPAGDPLAIDSEGWALGTNFLDNSVWFTFTTPPDGGHIQVDLFSTIDLAGNFNTQAAVYEVVDCGDFSTYTLVTSGDNSIGPELLSGQLFGTISAAPRLDLFCTEGNKTYAVAVDGGSNFFFQPIRDQGLFSIAINLVGPPEPAFIEALDHTIICSGDGEDDLIDVGVVDPGFGANQQWVITDEDLNILELPTAPPFNFDGVPAGTCLIWHINYDELNGADIGANAADLTGCFELSNPIEVIRLSGNDCGPDVELSITADRVLYGIYEHVTYNIVVTNNGTSEATGVNVTAGLPNGVVFGGHTSSQGDYNLFNENWDVGEIAAGGSAHLNMMVYTLTDAADLVNYVEVASMNEDDVDSTPGNGTSLTPNEDDEAAVTIAPNTNGGVAVGGGNIDLELSVEGSEAFYENFVNFNFTFTITNSGPDDASGIVVNLSKPTNAVYTNIDPVSISAGTFNTWFEKWEIDTLASGESATLVVEVFPLIGDATLDFYAEVFLTNEDDGDSTPGNGTAPTPNEDDEAAISVEKSMANLQMLSNNNSTSLLKTEYQVFPNPTINKITIAQQSEVNYLTTYNIVGAEGKLLRQYPVEVIKGSNTLDIDVSNLESGIYFIQTQGIDGAIKHLRFVKM